MAEPWTTMKPEERFAQDPLRFLREEFRDIEQERLERNLRIGIYDGDAIVCEEIKPWKNKAFVFEGRHNFSREASRGIYEFFCGSEADEPVLVHLAPVPEGFRYLRGELIGTEWHLIPGEEEDFHNYSGLTWVGTGIPEGYVLASSKRALVAELENMCDEIESERFVRIVPVNDDFKEYQHAPTDTPRAKETKNETISYKIEVKNETGMGTKEKEWTQEVETEAWKAWKAAEAGKQDWIDEIGDSSIWIPNHAIIRPTTGRQGIL